MRNEKLQYDILIKDISEGKNRGYMAILSKLDNSKVFGKDFDELFEGIQHTYKLFYDLKSKKKLKKLMPKKAENFQ